MQMSVSQPEQRMLEKTAEEIREKSGQVVRSIAADITTSEGEKRFLQFARNPIF